MTRPRVLAIPYPLFFHGSVYPYSYLAHVLRRSNCVTRRIFSFFASLFYTWILFFIWR